VRIALAQINPTVGDFRGNSAKIIDYAMRAKSAGVDLILFPELSVCGYPPRDLVERPWFIERNRLAAEEIASRTTGISVVCGLVTPAKSTTGQSVVNSAALLFNPSVFCRLMMFSTRCATSLLRKNRT
jgi:NAD+ synthase (glutamine-hydrolysing)